MSYENFFLKTAFTLIELIVSLMLVSIVVLGIFSINTALNNNSVDYGQRYLVKSETQTTLNHILNDASLAVGSATNVGNPSVLDQGILLPTTPGLSYGSNQTFCMHQGSESGGTWVCYTFDNTIGDSFYKQIYYCNNLPYNLNDPSGLRGASSNCGGNPQVFLGTVYSVTPAFTNSGGQLLFSITIQNCLNNANPPGTCSNTGTSTDPVNNPEAQITGSVIPTQSSI